ncbi:MAG TPA: hypothetical protein VJ770_16795 [Stellaceae bacterium]|nr:hypothetical protein [Stellaceae bacterium]
MPTKAGADEQPVKAHGAVAAGALDTLFARLRTRPVQDIGRWAREELYEDRHGRSRAIARRGFGMEEAL